MDDLAPPDEPTPEEIQRAAQMQAMALRGQQLPAYETPLDADVLSSMGGALAGLGGRAVHEMSQNLTHRADALRLLATKRAKGNAAIEANKGMELAVKDKFPEVWERLKGQGLTDAAWGKIYLQENSNSRTNTAQTGAERRAHFTQDRTDARFEKNYGLQSTKQAADLGARTVAGAFDLDEKAPKPISQEQATELAAMKAAADIVSEKAKEAKAIYGHGTPLPGSQADRRIRQLITEMYGPMLKTGGIGNLTDSHLHLLQDMVKNPSGDWTTYFNSNLFPTLLDSMVAGATGNLESQAHSMGRTFNKPGSPATTKEPPVSRGGPQQPPPAGMKWQTNIKTGERRLVPAGG